MTALCPAPGRERVTARNRAWPAVYFFARWLTTQPSMPAASAGVRTPELIMLASAARTFSVPVDTYRRGRQGEVDELLEYAIGRAPYAEVGGGRAGRDHHNRRRAV